MTLEEVYVFLPYTVEYILYCQPQNVSQCKVTILILGSKIPQFEYNGNLNIIPCQGPMGRNVEDMVLIMKAQLTEKAY